ncbi:MAG: selenium cofactor biosynthesis protein YqeC [Oscillospiraceae bacterium]
MDLLRSSAAAGRRRFCTRLTKECSMDARVIVCTTTHILKPSHLPCVLSGGEAEIQAALKESSCVCVGTKSETGKFGAPAISFERLLRLADYVFVEADGSKHLPLKAHAGHEPVVPKEANQTILVLGVSGLGRPIGEAAHRPALYAKKAWRDGRCNRNAGACRKAAGTRGAAHAGACQSGGNGTRTGACA